VTGWVIAYQVTCHDVMLSCWVRTLPGFVDNDLERDLPVLLPGIPSVRNNSPVFAMLGKRFSAFLSKIGHGHRR